MSLSVIIPASNIQKRIGTLQRMIRKGIEQGFEIILVLDDVSTDEETHLFSLIPVERIILVRGKYGSPGLARNAGLSLCSQDWVTFWDSDDFPYPECIFNALDDYYQKSTDLLVGGFAFVNALGKISKSHRFDLKTFGAHPGIWRFIFRTEFIRDVRFPPQKIGEDLVFLAEVLNNQPRLNTTSKIFYGYATGHGDSILNSTRRIELENSLEASFQNISRIPRQDYTSNNAIKKMFFLLIMRLNLSRMRHARNAGKVARIFFSLCNPNFIKSIGLKTYFRTIVSATKSDLLE